MRGAKIGLGAILALLVLAFPIRSRAQALPNFTADTLSTLEVVQGQLQNTLLNSNGLQLYQDATSSNVSSIGSLLLLFRGLYELNEAYQNYQAGQGFSIISQEVVNQDELPEGLEALEMAGETYKVGLDYFGHTVSMLVGPDGNIREFTNGKKAINVRAKDTMQTAVNALKAEATDKKHVALPHGNTNYAKQGVNINYQSLKTPYIQGKKLVFYMYIWENEYKIEIENFVNCAIQVLQTETYRNGYIGIQVFNNGNFNDIVVKSNGSVVSPYNGMTYGGRVTSSIFANSSGTRLYHVLPYTTNADYGGLSFKLPSSYRYDYYNFANGYESNSDANIQGMMWGNAIPIGDASQMYITVGAVSEIENFPNTPNQIVGTEISADSLEQIQSAITEIEPVTDPVTGIEIIEVPELFPLPEAVPLEVEPGEPIIPGGIEDFPQNDPEIAPPYDPSIDPATTPTEDTLPDSAEEIQPMEELQLVTGLQNRFPFSIPWDIYNAYKMLQAERETPHWEWEMSVNLPGGEVFTHTFVLDLEFIDPIVGLFRDLFLLAFILGLAIYSYNKFFGGGA